MGLSTLSQPRRSAASQRGDAASAPKPPRRPIPQEVQSQRARDTMAATPQESSFGRGAIVRVKLFQFLTYEAACFGVERVSGRRDSVERRRARPAPAPRRSLRTGRVPART